MDKPITNAKNGTFFLLIATWVLSFGWVSLVLRGGWSLGFFLAILLTETVFAVWLLSPPSGLSAERRANRRQNRIILLFLAGIVVLLALCMLLYSNSLLKAFNVLVLLVLLPVQYLMAAGVTAKGWDRPVFWLEMAASLCLRPFIGMPEFAGSVRRLFSKPSAPDSISRTRHTIGRVLLGILLAIPVLLLSGSLLASADILFAQWIGQIWQNLSLGETILRLALALLFLPFIFSFLHSGKSQNALLETAGFTSNTEKTASKGFRIDKIVLISFLTLINVLYIAFSVFQLTYLTGAFQAVLPEHLTFAQYARSGFFELAGSSAINLLLILAAVKGSDRRGVAGVFLRIESLLLVFGSLVQWASALFRMKMYIDVFGLSLLRFWVTAFMLLMLVFFILLIIKEFRSVFPLFKTGFVTALIALVLLNFVDCDAWTARYNVNHYKMTGQIDTAYFRQLSAGAVPAMLELSAEEDSEVAREMAVQLINRHTSAKLNAEDNGRWQRFNVSEARAYSMIDDDLDSLHALLTKADRNNLIPNP